ncbi:MAG: OmpA family protein [Elusimicrobiota bacterium]
MRRAAAVDDMEARLHKSVIWSVPLADFMSNLAALFLMLFAFSLDQTVSEGGPSLEESLQELQQEFGGTISAERLAKLTRQKQETDAAQSLKKAIEDQGLAGQAKVEMDEKRIKLIMTAPVLFDSGIAELKPGAQQVLSAVASSLKGSDGEVVVEGHTDNIPIKSGMYATNWELSLARSFAVVNFLLEQGMPPARLTATGYGEHRPVADNASREGRSANRRIEISLLRRKA